MSSSSFSCTNFGRACVLQYMKMLCKCNKYADLRIATTDRNPHKLFFACKDHVCGFVGWAHPINCPCHDKESSHNVEDIEDVSHVADVVKALDDRITSVENDVKKTSKVMDEIKNIATSSKMMFTSMLLMVFLTFFIVLVK
ncbi:hypothetical protein L195_g041226 [Trifolium pratense]|uniref:Zinc finger GRF-type domain-containing protein n=1 Tax=Trifolium pratense TaxID=57577 RepID=A0A2K3M308_TRIPR|nr:hypothetical protein L195_g041226 [Trifolium pratense]